MDIEHDLKACRIFALGFQFVYHVRHPSEGIRSGHSQRGISCYLVEVEEFAGNVPDQCHEFQVPAELFPATGPERQYSHAVKYPAVGFIVEVYLLSEEFAYFFLETGPQRTELVDINVARLHFSLELISRHVERNLSYPVLELVVIGVKGFYHHDPESLSHNLGHKIVDLGRGLKEMYQSRFIPAETYREIGPCHENSEIVVYIRLVPELPGQERFNDGFLHLPEPRPVNVTQSGQFFHGILVRHLLDINKIPVKRAALTEHLASF